MIGMELSAKDALKHYFGFDQFKGRQETIIENVLNQRNTFVIMPTGGGKSMCYQLPALMSEGTAIVVSPLIALMKNQVDAIRGVSEADGVAHFLNSSLTKAETIRVKEDVLAGTTKMLYVAPESLTKKENIEFLHQANISFYAIDEAHCISEWGHDFRPEYRRLRAIISDISEASVIALTATATEKVQEDILKNLGIPDADVFKASFNRANLLYEVRPKRDVNKNLIRFVSDNRGKSGIIYCLSRKKVEEIAETLRVNGIKALPYHAGMDAATRARHQDQFLMEEVDIIVATIAFGMGIDKPDVRFVVHHDIPKSLESYYQETGRAGRDGGEGRCLAFYSYRDVEKLEKFLQGKHVSEMEVGRQLLSEIVAYAETSVCRRKFILHYFGEEYEAENCGMCDNCLHPKEKMEGSNEVKRILMAVDAVKQKHDHRYVVSFLTGEVNSELLNYKDNQHEMFGSGKDQEAIFWRAVIRQALLDGLLEKEVETYGVLKITSRGRRFMKKPWSFILLKENDYSGGDDIGANGNGRGTTDPTLHKMLQELRKDESHKKSLPPFAIFQDISLEEMSIQYPISQEELVRVSGVGQNKGIKFGEPFLELIKRYVDENEIERPEDFRMRSIVKKSGSKVQLIQNIDRKLPLENIADAKHKSVTDIVDEIDAIVASGTRVNIDYYIDDILDEEDQDDIFDYFMEADTDDINAAMEEFDGDFSEDQLKLMRIKFMSEVAH